MPVGAKDIGARPGPAMTALCATCGCISLAQGHSPVAGSRLGGAAMAGDVNAMFNQSKVLQDLGTTIPGRELYEGPGEAGDVDARTDSPLFAGQIRSRAPLGRSRLTVPSTPALVVIGLTLMGLVLRVAIVFRPLAL